MSTTDEAIPNAPRVLALLLVVFGALWLISSAIALVTGNPPSTTWRYLPDPLVHALAPVNRLAGVMGLALAALELQAGRDLLARRDGAARRARLAAWAALAGNLLTSAITWWTLRAAAGPAFRDLRVAYEAELLVSALTALVWPVLVLLSIGRRGTRAPRTELTCP